MIFICMKEWRLTPPTFGCRAHCTPFVANNEAESELVASVLELYEEVLVDVDELLANSALCRGRPSDWLCYTTSLCSVSACTVPHAMLETMLPCYNIPSLHNLCLPRHYLQISQTMHYLQLGGLHSWCAMCCLPIHCLALSA